MSEYRTLQNSIYPRCVDGRAAEVFVEWESGAWIVSRRGDEARAENGPQFLGASLVFVRALEIVGHVGRLRAFDFTEQASEQAGLGLQIHLDDDHGQYDLAAMDDDAIAALIPTHHTGCGFAKDAWGGAAARVIDEAKRRKWRVQILTGTHAETGGVINYRPGETFDTAAGVAAEQSAFNTDIIDARRVFAVLEDLIHRAGFADEAERWMIATYRDVVVALGGAAKPDDVAELR